MKKWFKIALVSVTFMLLTNGCDGDSGDGGIGGDSTKPVIILNGPTVVTLVVGDTYIDAGAEATDDVDGNITDKIITVSDVNSSKVGTYHVTYNVKDNAGNKADECTRIVIVRDFVPFTTIWWLQEPNESITIPINPNLADEYNYTVDWGDGNISNDVSDTITHMYEKEGNYTVKITGNFPAIYLNAGLSDDGAFVDNWKDTSSYYYSRSNNSFWKLLKITNWGDIKWKSFRHAFAHASNLKIVTSDVPNLKHVKDMSFAFLSVRETPENMGDWNVSNVTNFTGIFATGDDSTTITGINGNLERWDVGHATTMDYMFYAAYHFNQAIGDWNVSSVTNMKYMFYGACDFNQSLSRWDVSNVTDMQYMFAATHSFNQPLNVWNVSNVTNMSGMFIGAKTFNQPLDQWDVSHVRDFSFMFGRYYFEGNMLTTYSSSMSFNQPLNDWDVSSATNMRGMFAGSTSFNQPLNDWDVSSVTDMRYLFREATVFNQPLDSWDVSNVSDMKKMFYNAVSFDRNISVWDVSNVIYSDDFATNSPIDGTDKMPRFQ